MVYLTPEVIENLDGTNGPFQRPKLPSTTGAKNSSTTTPHGEMNATVAIMQQGNDAQEEGTAAVPEGSQSIANDLYTYVGKLTKQSAETLHKLSTVSNLRLKIDRNSQDTFKHVMKKLTTTSKIQKLELHRTTTTTTATTTGTCTDSGGTENNPRRTIQELRALFFVVRGLPNLKRLDLHHFGVETPQQETGTTGDDERTKELEAVADILLKDHPTLHTLHLHVHGCIPESLMKVISELPMLKHLHLHLYQSEDYSKIIANSRTLKELYVHPMKPFTYKLDHVKSIMDSMNRKWKAEMEDFDDTETMATSSESTTVVSATRNLRKGSSSLRILDLGGPTAKITTNGVKALACALRDNTCLKRIAFSYSNPTSHRPGSSTTNEEAISVLGDLCCALCCNTTLKSLRNHCSSRLDFSVHGDGGDNYNGASPVIDMQRQTKNRQQILVDRAIQNLMDTLRYNPTIMEFDFFQETLDVSMRKHRAISLHTRYVLNMMDKLSEYIPTCCYCF